MRRKYSIFSSLLLSLTLLLGACAMPPQSSTTSIPAAVIPSSAPEASPIPEEEACVTCELPEIEPLPEGFSLTAPDGAQIPEETDPTTLCPPLGEGNSETAAPDEPGVYRQLTSQDAKEWMDEDESVIVVDVRTKEEYEAGHIPGALLIPNETIENTPPEELPDKSAKILIYCRSGNRSYQASLKLLEMGYDFIYDFGGINTWPYEIVTGP